MTQSSVTQSSLELKTISDTLDLEIVNDSKQSSNAKQHSILYYIFVANYI